MKKFVAYRRVSTSEQGKSGLGLDAQAQAIAAYVESQGGSLVEDFREVETGKGSNALDRRPVLNQAIEVARKQRATLLVARLDRLSRNVHFISGVMERGVDFRAVDQPTADKTMLHFYAVMAEAERDRIALNIKRALAAKKAKGQTLGNAASLQPLNGARSVEAQRFAKRLQNTLQAFKRAGLTQRAMADELNALGLPTARGGQWTQMQVWRVLERLA